LSNKSQIVPPHLHPEETPVAQCIWCSVETSNIRRYHTARILDSSYSEDYYTWQSTTTFGEFQEHTIAICEECYFKRKKAAAKWEIRFGVAVGISLVLACVLFIATIPGQDASPVSPTWTAMRTAAIVISVAFVPLCAAFFVFSGRRGAAEYIEDRKLRQVAAQAHMRAEGITDTAVNVKGLSLFDAGEQRYKVFNEAEYKDAEKHLLRLK
jgi:hypothetical protein